MILHILVGDLILESFPKKCKWLKLQLFADDVKEYGIFSDQFFGENIIRFNQTVHIPTDDFESVITKVAFSVNAIKFDGTHLAIGNTSLLCSSIEQAATKSLVLHDKLEAYVGRLTVTVFHNPTPVDLGDDILYKHNTYQPNLKEFGFLLSRRKNRPDQAGSHPISFNHNQERSINETVAEYKSTEEALRGIRASAKNTKENEAKKELGQHVFTSKLFGKHNYDTPLVRRASAPINQIQKSPPANKPVPTQSVKKSQAKTHHRVNIHLRDPPKLRQTIKSVGYVHNKWPEKEAFEHDKWEFKNHLADQRRLALLKEVAEETKFRNQKDEERRIEARARKLRLAQEDVALQSVLASKEEEIKRLRYQVQLMKSTANRPPRPSSAPAATSARRTPARTPAAAAAAASAAVASAPRSPDSKLNRENSMALRLLQRKMSHSGQKQHSERIYSAAKARGESYTPHYASAYKGMSTRASTGSVKKRRHSSSSLSASYQRPTSSSNRYRTSTGSSEMIRSWSNDRRAHSAAVVQGRYTTPSHRSTGELSRSRILTDIDLSSDNGDLFADPSGLMRDDAASSGGSSNSDEYVQVPHQSPSKVVKIPSPGRYAHSSGGGSFSKAPRSSDWLANARASVSQLQSGNHLFLHDLHKQQHRQKSSPKKSPDGHHKTPGASGHGSSASKKAKSTSPYAIIEKMATKYPNKHFASHPYFSDSDNFSDASGRPEFDSNGIVTSASARATGSESETVPLTTAEILKRREKELEAREQLLKAEMNQFYKNKPASNNGLGVGSGRGIAAPSESAVNVSSSFDTSFSSHYLDTLSGAAATSTQGNNGGGNVPGFLNAFVHSDAYPPYTQAELNALDRSMDSTPSSNNTSLLNTANILLNAEKKIKLLPVRSSKESDTFKYNYKIAAGAPAASGSSNVGASDGSVTSAARTSSSVDHHSQIAAQFEKNRKFAADGAPVEEINYADLSQQVRSTEQKERLITSQFEKNRLYQLQQQQQQQLSKVSTEVPPRPSVDTSEVTLSSSLSKVSLMSPDQLNRKMEEVGQAMGSLEKRIDSFIQNSASKQLLRANISSSSQSTPEATSAPKPAVEEEKKPIASLLTQSQDVQSPPLTKTSAEVVEVTSDSDDESFHGGSQGSDSPRRSFERAMQAMKDSSSGEE